MSIILFVVVIYMILTRIFGHSATDLAIVIGLVVLLFTNQYGLNREIGELRISIKHSFENVKNDIELIKRRLKIETS